MRVVVQCQPDEDPALDSAPSQVTVRPGTLTCEDVSQLRRVLHTLITTERRVVTVDFAEVDVVRCTNVVAVLVGAAREARGHGSTVRVQNPPTNQRRALFVAGIDEVAASGADGYEVVVGTCEESATEPLAV